MEKCFIGQDGQQLPPVLQEIKLHLYIFTIDDKFFQANICILLEARNMSGIVAHKLSG
jgi:hypothetical protein